MISKVYSAFNIGLNTFLVSVEWDSSKALPTIDIVWLADTSVKEAKERIKSAFKNIGITLPPKKFIINLSPSNLKKSWNNFDLPIAVSILNLILDNIDNSWISTSLFVWELGLDGEIKPVNGIIPLVLEAKKQGFKHFFIPEGNSKEASYIGWINIVPVKNLQDVINIITNKEKPVFLPKSKLEEKYNILVDFADIKWNHLQKRALMVAAAWMHNLLMIWPPGSWKTLLAKALMWILPPLSEDEILETSMIYSVKGLLNNEVPVINFRPFRIVHHTASSVSIIGWGSNLQPGEISLANNWVLFFDELPEFPRSVLEVLRQPLEDRQITISRSSWTTTYPAKFMFVAAMNPCKCWFFQDKEKECTCSINDVKKYQSKISWPLLDRFDLLVEVPRQKIDKILSSSKEESSVEIRKKVIKAWEIQRKRYEWEKIHFNSQLDAKLIDKYCKLDDTSKNILKQASEKLFLSARAIHRIIKLARTLADLEWVENISSSHILEALQYRSKSMFVA